MTGGQGASPKRVLVVDDHDGIRQAIAAVLDDFPDAEVVGEAADGAEAVRLVRELRPDVVLLDVQMPEMDGPTATPLMRAAHSQVRVCALTAMQDPQSVASMLAAGADSYLVKTAPDLRLSLRAVLDGRLVLAPEVVPAVVSALSSRLRDEQERADSLAELDRVKREFISLVSDQLANPLTAIGGYAKTLRTGWRRLNDGDKQEFLGRIDQQAGLLARRLDQILTVARLQLDDRSTGSTFALDQMVRSIVDSFVADGDGAASRLLVGTQPVQVVGDPVGLGDAVRRLVENAFVHTQGDVRVLVERRDGAAWVQVCDDGPGFDPSTVGGRELFSPGDASDTRRVPGMGLSLYITRHVVQSSGGYLRLDSAPDRGTTAEIRLPLKA